MCTFGSLVQGIVGTLAIVSTLWAQVAVVAPGSRELKRAAHRLRVTPERLQNMRVALREATEVARRMEPGTAPMIGSIAQGWVQFNRPEAKSNLEELYRDLRMAASNAEDARRYQSADPGGPGARVCLLRHRLRSGPGAHPNLAGTLLAARRGGRS